MKKTKVCVVGAGVSGLVTVKELLEEGHDVVFFEQEAKEGLSKAVLPGVTNNIGRSCCTRAHSFL